MSTSHNGMRKNTFQVETFNQRKQRLHSSPSYPFVQSTAATVRRATDAARNACAPTYVFPKSPLRQASSSHVPLAARSRAVCPSRTRPVWCLRMGWALWFKKKEAKMNCLGLVQTSSPSRDYPKKNNCTEHTLHFTALARRGRRYRTALSCIFLASAAYSQLRKGTKEVPLGKCHRADAGRVGTVCTLCFEG